MFGMCEVLGIEEGQTLKLMLDRVANPDLTYGKRLVELIKKDGYINTHVKLSRNNKQTSIDNLNNSSFTTRNEFQEFVNIALVGK